MGIRHSNRTRWWLNGLIPYDISDTDFPDCSSQRRDILAAIDHWNANTVIRLVPHQGETNYAIFVAAPFSCSSPVGMRSDPQEIRCAVGAGFSTGSIIHEIGHAAGLWHEHTREDRDQFVTIQGNNIISGQEHNFVQHIDDGDDVGAYDYGSIMHYSRRAFASDTNKDTITPPDGMIIGQKNALSSGDIDTIEATYTSLVRYRSLIANEDYRNWRLQGNHDGRVDLYPNPTNTGTRWRIEPAGSYIRIVCLVANDTYRGWYLQANHDGRVDLYPNPGNTGTRWRVEPSVGFIRLKSLIANERYRGWYLQANHDGRVDLYPNPGNTGTRWAQEF